MSFGSSFKFWCFEYDELRHQFSECHKLKSHLCKNILVEEPDEMACDPIYDDLDSSEEVF